ncbi:hypothetical protein DM860_017399 [Cuscuta australis]|uniref:Uncharacterized protein n=1 Tax=Cuscuta australis TaxID=267555 RepID=A0A328DUX6_9ASTE|nr:hypothetical protein DM860_017399 [Cuscuta australis]
MHLLLEQQPHIIFQCLPVGYLINRMKLVWKRTRELIAQKAQANQS